AFINKQLVNLSNASISTLHSFCLDITRKYFQIIDLDPSLTIGDENQISMLKDRAIDQLLDEAYEKEDPIFIRLLEMFNNKRDDRSIKEIIQDLHRFIVNRPEPRSWAKK